MAKKKEIKDITVKITRHIIERMNQRGLSDRKDLETHLKDLLFEKTIIMYESKHKNVFRYVYSDGGDLPSSVIVFTQMENDMYMATTAYRTFIDVRKVIIHKFFITDVVLPFIPKTENQKIDEEIELLEDEKINIGHQIIELQMKCNKIDYDINELKKTKEEK